MFPPPAQRLLQVAPLRHGTAEQLRKVVVLEVVVVEELVVVEEEVVVEELVVVVLLLVHLTSDVTTEKDTGVES